MVEEIKCPIETGLQYLGKKWSFEIIRDMFFGKKRFNEFLASKPKLSSKVLSTRLKELQENGIIEKLVTNTYPVNIKYELTTKGKALNKIIYELAVYELRTCNEFIENGKLKECAQPALEMLKKALDIFD